MAVKQPELVRALLDPAAPVPDGLTSKASKHDKRFAVYRNNIAASLADALSVGFPVVCRLVGEKFFRAMAASYILRHPPKSPMLMFFGEALPEFLEGFEPAAGLPYLPDVARLEIAIRESYHAEDSRPMDRVEASSIPPNALEAATIKLAPSLRCLRSKHPIFQIWRLNTSGGPIESRDPEDVMIARRQYDPVPERLSNGGYEFVSALGCGETLSSACDIASRASDEFDLNDILVQLLNAGTIVKIVPGRVQSDSNERPV